MMVQPPEAACSLDEDSDQGLNRSVRAILGSSSADTQQRTDVRERMFAILARDRDDGQ